MSWWNQAIQRLLSGLNDKGSGGDSRKELGQSEMDTSKVGDSVEDDLDLIKNVDRVAPFLETDEGE
jgi:hypothetical protein